VPILKWKKQIQFTERDMASASCVKPKIRPASRKKNQRERRKKMNTMTIAEPR
jgi:hypothetical protein